MADDVMNKIDDENITAEDTDDVSRNDSDDEIIGGADDVQNDDTGDLSDDDTETPDDEPNGSEGGSGDDIQAGGAEDLGDDGDGDSDDSGDGNVNAGDSEDIDDEDSDEFEPPIVPQADDTPLFDSEGPFLSQVKRRKNNAIYEIKDAAAREVIESLQDEITQLKSDLTELDNQSVLGVGSYSFSDIIIPVIVSNNTVYGRLITGKAISGSNISLTFTSMLVRGSGKQVSGIVPSDADFGALYVDRLNCIYFRFTSDIVAEQSLGSLQEYLGWFAGTLTIS